MTLNEGDAVSLRGALKAEVWENRISLSIIADKVLPLTATPNRDDGRPKQRREPVQVGDPMPWERGVR